MRMETRRCKKEGQENKMRKEKSKLERKMKGRHRMKRGKVKRRDGREILIKD